MKSLFIAVHSKRKLIIAFVIALLASFIAITQPFGLSPDYENYKIFFQGVREGFFNIASETRFEIGFVYLAGVLAKIWSPDLIVYGVLVFISMMIKSYVIQKMSIGYFVTIAFIFYLFKIFPLHELTQLRVALSVAFLLCACYYIWNGNRRRGIIMSSLALLFHYSSLMLSPLLFLKKYNRRQTIILSTCLFVILHVISRYIVVILTQFLSVFQSYQDIGFVDESVNPISPVFLPEFFMIFFALRFWRDMTDVMRKIIVLELIGFAIFYGTIQFPIIAVRGRELYSVLWVLFVGQGGGTTRRLKLAILIFVLLSMTISVYSYFFRDFFH